MKKVLSVFIALMFVALPSCAILASAEEVLTLDVFNWGEYISDGSDGSLDVNAAFEEYYEKTYGQKIQVNYTNYETNEAMYSKLKAGGTNYDIIIPSDYMIARLISENMLEKLDYSNIPNNIDVDNRFKGGQMAYDPNNQYSVPYTWGTVGLIYNTKEVSQAPTSWNALWDEQYKGKILMFNNPRDAFAIAQSLLGYSYNSTNQDEWKAAADKLIEQRPLVQAYCTDEIFNKMESGEAILAPCYAGDYVVMHENNPDLAFVEPQESFNSFVDCLCIPKGAEHKTEAERYINYLCSYEPALANAEFIGYSSPITTVMSSDEYTYKDDPIIYPSAQTLERSEDFLFLDSQTQSLMDNLWDNVKNTTVGIWVYFVLGGVLLAAVAFIVIRKVKSGRE